MSGVDLFDANLSHTNLSHAKLRGSNLRGANLSESDLSHADLSGANLVGTNLAGTNLSGTDLTGAIDGNVCRMDFGGWSICIRSDRTSIGCKNRPNDWWLTASDAEIDKLNINALAWWRVYGPAIKSTIKVIKEQG